jgi:DNA-binding transcriptional LysR family regulator
VDRLDALSIFVAVAEERGFAAAARRLGRSPAAVTRAVAALEDRLGLRLFNRTTRAVALTDAGARHLELCRRLLAEFEELEESAASERVEPRGAIAVTAPVVFGRLHVLPVLLAYLRDHPGVDARLLLLDRVVALVDEGIDVGVRLGHLPDSSLRAIGCGAVRRVVCASPAYLAARGAPLHPRDLARHACIAFEGAASLTERWIFGRRGGEGGGEIVVAVRPKLAVNTAEAALDAALAGAGLTRVLSYQADGLIAARRLRIVLEAFEPPPVPIHVVQPAGRHPPAKVRLFVDRAVAALRERFADARTA